MLRPDTFALTTLLALLTGIGPFSTDLYLPSLPAIGRLLDATTAEVQLTLSAYLFGFAFGQVFYGPVSDRFGRRPVLLSALALYCVASVACATAPTIAALTAARVAQALGAAGTIVLARAIVRDLYSGARAGRELSLMGMIMALAPILAPVIGGFLESSLGWRTGFYLLAALGVVAAAAVWRLLPETLERPVRDALSPASILRVYRHVGANGAFLANLAIICCVFAGLFAWISAAPFVLQSLYGLAPIPFGIAFAMCSFGYMIGASIAARLVMPLGLDRTIGLGAAAHALGGLAMVIAIALDLNWFVAVVLPMALYLAGLGLALPQATAAALTPFPDRAGAAASLLGFVQQVSAALLGVLVGHLLGASAWPLAVPVALMGGLALAIWAATRTIREPAVRGKRAS